MKNIFGVIIIVVLAYFAYHAYIREYIFESDKWYKKSAIETFERPSVTSIQTQPIPYAIDHNVVSSGPNAPSEAPNTNEVVITSPPAAKDPYYEEQQMMHETDELRHPERMFRPATTNDGTEIAVNAGIASHTTGPTSQNIQPFNTEFVQSGGEFMSGVFANDMTLPNSFSTF
jgi:hypothetical protein